MASFLSALEKHFKHTPPPKVSTSLIDFSQPSLYISIASIIFNPTVWNIVARNEYRNKTLTKVLGGPYRACYLMAITILLCGFLRDGLFHRAVQAQPASIPDHAFLKPLALALGIVGQVLVLSSTWALGITGTYLGDYCGILQDKMVTGFPFNVQTDPMYNGSTLCFLATALWYRSAAGVLVTGIVYIVYQIALRFEGPFTSKIYAAREAKRSSSSESGKSSAAAPSTPKKPTIKSTGSSSSFAAFRPPAPPVANESYADAVKISPATPPPASAAKKESTGTPARMTRSRSKARTSDDEL